MNKLKTERVLVVEGRYDASKLQAIIETTIITLDGFSIYKDKEKQNLLKRLGRKNGILLLTDADAAGFRLRTFVSNIVGEKYVLQAYTPAIKGKEKRKAIGGKEGLLGVEGVNSDLLYDIIKKALESDEKAFNVNDATLQITNKNNLELNAQAQKSETEGNTQSKASTLQNEQKQRVTYLDLYNWGLSGKVGSAQRKIEFLKALNLPPRLSKKELVDVLNRLYDYDFLQEKVKEFN